MSDLEAIADRVEIEALRGEYTDAAMMRDYARLFSAACCWQDSHSGPDGPYRRLHDSGRGARWLCPTCASRPWIY
jgi:hypothetical protein